MGEIIDFPPPTPDPENIALCCSGCGEVEFILLATGDIQCSNCGFNKDGLIWGIDEPGLPPAA
jgi:hypothetical protein